MKNKMKKGLAFLLSFAIVLSLVAVQIPYTAKAATAVTFSCTAKRVAVGGKYTLTIQGVTDKKATYSWSTSNKKVATVSKKGVISGIAEGTATIKCKITLSDKSTQTLSCKVTVKEQKAAMSVSINNANLDKNNVHTILVGESYDFNRTLFPAKSNDKTYWYILDEEYAEVDESGIVTAKKAGTTTLVAKVGIDRVSAEEATNTVVDSLQLNIVEYTGLKENNGELQYYTEGEKDYRYTGLAEYEGKWWYVESGKVNKNYKGVAYKNDGMWYIKNGTIDYTANGTVEYLGRTFEVVNGRIESTVSFIEENDVVLDVEKTLIAPIFDVEDMIYNEESFYEFEIEEKGLYWIQMRYKNYDYSSASYSSPYICSWSVLDRFLTEQSGISRPFSYNYGSSYDRINNHNAYFLNTIGNYMLYQAPTVDRYREVYFTGEIFLVKPYVDISNVTVINDGFSEEIFDYMMDDATENKYAVVYYEYIPEKTGNYVFWFDNINISKDKEVYKNNPLFELSIANQIKTIYVNGEGASLELELEEGKTYPITLFVYDVENSEKWRNGDVEYSMQISCDQERNITGYTAVQNRIESAGNKNTYTMMSYGNQTIEFTLSQMRQDASVNVYVYDSNGNMIQEYKTLKNNAVFTLSNTLRNTEYKIVVEGNKAMDYCMNIDYSATANTKNLTQLDKEWYKKFLAGEILVKGNVDYRGDFQGNINDFIAEYSTDYGYGKKVKYGLWDINNDEVLELIVSFESGPFLDDYFLKWNGTEVVIYDTMSYRVHLGYGGTYGWYYSNGIQVVSEEWSDGSSEHIYLMLENGERISLDKDSEILSTIDGVIIENGEIKITAPRVEFITLIDK